MALAEVPRKGSRQLTWERSTEYGEGWWQAKLNGVRLAELSFEESDPSWMKTIFTITKLIYISTIATNTTTQKITAETTTETTHYTMWTNGHESFVTTDGTHGTSCNNQ